MIGPRGLSAGCWRADVVPGRLPRSPVRVANDTAQGPLPIHGEEPLKRLATLPKRTLSTIASIRITGHTASNGLAAPAKSS